MPVLRRRHLSLRKGRADCGDNDPDDRGMGVIGMADTPVLIPPGLVGMVNVGGGGKLRRIEGTLNYGYSVRSVVITGIPRGRSERRML